MVNLAPKHGINQRNTRSALASEKEKKNWAGALFGGGLQGNRPQQIRPCGPLQDPPVTRVNLWLLLTCEVGVIPWRPAPRAQWISMGKIESAPIPLLGELKGIGTHT